MTDTMESADQLNRPQDLPKWLSWGLFPALGLVIILALLLELWLGPGWMQSGFYPQPDGTSVTWYVLLTYKEGPAEYLTVLAILPGIFAAIYAFLRRKRFPNRKLGWWMAICALGMIYFAGEELSWGHHIAVTWFGKHAEPVSMTALGLNEQGETNIHNLDNWLGKMLGRNSKNVVEIWCYVGALAMPLILARRRPPLPPSDPGYWFWPTCSTVVVAALVFLVYRPVRFYIHLAGIPSEQEPYWARQSELQEYFMAATLSIYLLSIAWRLRQMPDAASSTA